MTSSGVILAICAFIFVILCFRWWYEILHHRTKVLVMWSNIVMSNDAKLLHICNEEHWKFYEFCNKIVHLPRKCDICEYLLRFFSNDICLLSFRAWQIYNVCCLFATYAIYAYFVWSTKEVNILVCGAKMTNMMYGFIIGETQFTETYKICLK